MSDYAELLRQKRRIPTAVFHLFRMKRARKPNDLYLFFEGEEDEDYYLPALERARTRECDIQPIWCDGKAGVLEVRALVYGEIGRGCNVLFFVDKDLEDILGEVGSGDQQTYVTDLYSIENTVCSEEFVRKFGSDFLKIERFGGDVNDMVREFRECRRRFIEAIRPIAVAHVALKMASLSPNMNNVSLDKLLECDSNGMWTRRSSNYVELLKQIGLHGKPSLPSLPTCWQKLRKLAPDLYIRGKFEMWFLTHFLNGAWRKLVSGLPKTIKKSKKTFDILPSNFFTIFRARIDWPLSLVEFLKVQVAAGRL